MTASGFEKLDLGKNRFYWLSFIGYGGWPITLQLPLDTLASLCKLIADWLSGPVVDKPLYNFDELSCKFATKMIHTYKG